MSALEPVLQASLVLDQRKPQDAPLARFTRACRSLGRSDPLIKAYRAVCRAEGDTFTANLRLPTCKSTGRCRARIRRYGDDMRRQIVASRALNTNLKTTVADEDCRSAMRITQRALTTMLRLRSATKGLVSAIASGSIKRLQRAQARFYSIDRSPLLDHRGRLDSFNAACT